MPRDSTRLVLMLTITGGLLSIGYGVMFTVLDDFRDSYGISESGLGLVVAAGFFTSFLAQITLAPLADRGHARRLVVAGLVIDALGLVVMAYGTTLPVLLGGRVLMGIGMGMASPAIRRVVIISDPQNLGRNLGRILSADVAGFAAGPVLSAILVGPFGIKAPFLVLAVVSVFMLLVVSRTGVAEETTPSTEKFALDLLRQRALAGAIVIGLAMFLMIGTFDSLWAVVMDDLDAPTWMANVGITIFALPLIILGPLGGKLAQRYGPFRLASLGLVVAALFMSAYGLLPAAWMLLAAGLFHSLSDGFTITGSGVAVGTVVHQERQAAAQGLLGGLQTLMGGLAATSAGWSYEHLGRGTTFVGCGVLMVGLVGLGSWLAGPAWHVRPGSEDMAGADILSGTGVPVPG